LIVWWGNHFVVSPGVQLPPPPGNKKTCGGGDLHPHPFQRKRARVATLALCERHFSATPSLRYAASCLREAATAKAGAAIKSFSEGLYFPSLIRGGDALSEAKGRGEVKTKKEKEQMPEKIISHSVEETRQAGARIAKTAEAGDVYALIGELGSGKTEFARGFVEALCGPAAVRSPTFSIVNIHEAPEFPLYHFDFYRLKKKEELVEIGFNDYVSGDGVALIEWADMFPDVLPDNTRRIVFTDKGDNEREIYLQ
jgi:tRNA threonylcarbamoyladenosine biosynthesis protein TsaE